MPRIGNSTLDGVVFLYPTVDDAERHIKFGGTAFLVGHPIIVDGKPIDAFVPYAVSNRHVVWSSGCSVIRVNRRYGPPAIIELDPTDWIANPNGSDVAVAPIIKHIDQTIHKISFIQTSMLITKEKMLQFDIGIGDEVFMVGRFVNHQGKTDNKPAVRFGSISMMPEPIWNSAINKDQLSYAVEMRSRTGFSGSVVAVYRTLATVLTKVRVSHFYGVLGVNWGYIIDEDRENTWLNGVAPAWEILETLEVPKLADVHKRATDGWIRMQQGVGGAAVPSVVLSERLEPPTTDEIHGAIL